MSDAVERLLNPATVRERAERVFALARAGGTPFAVDEARLAATADLVAQVTRDNYPQLDIPFHSRWRHFEADGKRRLTAYRDGLKKWNVEDAVRSQLDLVVVSVLLDAGAGDQWRFHDAPTGTTCERSEGLAVASLRMFEAGLFSSDPQQPWRVDAAALLNLDETGLARGFQVSEKNPLTGLEGRLTLLKNLGRSMTEHRALFTRARPSDVWDEARRRAGGAKTLRAVHLLRAVQEAFGPIWPGRLSLEGVNMGDVWRLDTLGGGTDAWVPFHKLSQWMTYSLVDPIVMGGNDVVGFDDLTGLPEYRNGGLLIDMGVLVPRRPDTLSKEHDVDSETVVAWRALTVALLDRLAPLVRQRLGKTEAELPVGKVLEGGSWSAGRRIAREKRTGGGSPLKIRSDGTVF